VLKNSFENWVYTSDWVSTSFFRYTSLWKCHAGHLYFDISIYVYNASVLITFCFYQSTVLKTNYMCVTVLSSIFEAFLPMTPFNVFQWDISYKCTFCTVLTAESSQWIDVLWNIGREKDRNIFWRMSVHNGSVGCQAWRYFNRCAISWQLNFPSTLTGVWCRDKWTLRPRLNVTYFRNALVG
jgi:hypothetical protein